MKDLFDTYEEVDFKPLAEKMRPTTLDDFEGQDEIVSKDSAIRKMIENDKLSSMIFWGPPGVGKTTLAKIIARTTESSFYELSAVTSGVKEVKEIFEIAKLNKMNNKKTILFVDEIHRFNKLQQDAFLSYVENGDIILIGATTENPSFEVNKALLSRVKVYILKQLTEENIKNIIRKAITKYYSNYTFEEDCITLISDISGGDARNALNTLENLMSIRSSKTKKVTKKDLEKALQSKTMIYDKNGEEHYNLISALHKSIRNSDTNAAIYYLARMLESGEDPIYIVRRLIRCASEDIGMANSQALVQAVSTYQAIQLLGMPECNVHLTQLVIYLSISPKSNSVETAYLKARESAIKTANVKVPLHLRNAVTKLDSENGYGKGYKYAHNYKNHITDMQCMPDEVKNEIYYEPSNEGKESNIKKILEEIEKKRKGS